MKTTCCLLSKIIFINFEGEQFQLFDTERYKIQYVIHMYTLPLLPYLRDVQCSFIQAVTTSIDLFGRMYISACMYFSPLKDIIYILHT
jgi:hypothetical protein